MILPHLNLHNRLVSSWNLEESSGSRVDIAPLNSLKASANNLTAVNSPGNGVGKVGNAVDTIRASAQYLSLVTNSSIGVLAENFSVSGWFNMDITPTGEGVIIQKGIYPIGFSHEYVLSVTSGLAPVFARAGVTQTMAMTLSLSTWYFFCLRYNATTDLFQCTIDTTTESFSAGDAGFSGALHIANGGYTPAGYIHDGKIDAVNFWKKVLTDGEVAWMRRSGAGVQFPLA